MRRNREGLWREGMSVRNEETSQSRRSNRDGWRLGGERELNRAGLCLKYVLQDSLSWCDIGDMGMPVDL